MLLTISAVSLILLMIASPFIIYFGIKAEKKAERKKLEAETIGYRDKAIT